ncbi:tyrosine-type recombinase/integrase [Amphiplicatus metriothermophilus]|uniref:Integrase n=1 Tax=Amphiplicatus metriothermophilus TaxID=1519374 RepID=A0A239PYP0_9PROT|nr:site-specific integrase [Amphiplicatus metriothermophilus]MBB5519884.1 integrase [Amphiplicatus metriothermophilus]SNT74787.1 Integrase [Amphiplicatus metriothermophilus]
MAIEKLTDAAIRAAKPRAKLYHLADGGGLYLAVTPGGAKSWRLVYRYGGRQRRLALGLYPALDLAGAREKRREAMTMLARDGLDPAVEYRRRAREAALRANNTFGRLADELIAKRAREGAAKATMDRMRWMRALAAPIAGRPLDDIEPYDVLALLTPLDRRGKHETARRLREFVGQVFKLAVALHRARRNPVADLDPKLVLTAAPARPRAAIVEPAEVGALWRTIDAYPGRPETRLALKLLMLTAARPGEVRRAEWREFDLAGATWTIPAKKMKMRRPHRVPLSPQALAILEELRPLTGGGRYLFPNARRPAKGPMSEAAMGYALCRMGYGRAEVTPHGFRSAFSSLANESGLWSADAIERQLAHVAPGVRGIYDRGARWDERVRLMAWWAEELDRLAAGRPETVVPLSRKAGAA